MRSSRFWPYAAELFLLIGAGMMFALLFETFLGRVQYPYSLEWMEGGMLVHGQRVMEGKDLYVLPSLDFIPFIYPPLYSWFLGWGGQVFEYGYSLGRSITLLSTVFASLAIVAGLRLEQVNWGVAALSAALFVSGYDEVGTFYDLVRADGLLIALLSWALVSVRAGAIRIGGLLLFCAFLCKHNAAIFGFPCVTTQCSDL